MQLMHRHLQKGSLTTALDEVCFAPRNSSTVVTCTVSLSVLPAPLLQQVLTSSLGQEPGTFFCINPKVSVLAPIPNSPIPYCISGRGVGVKREKKRKEYSQERSLLVTLPRNNPTGCLAQSQLLLFALGQSCQSSLYLVLAYHVYVLGPLLDSLPHHFSCDLLRLRLQLEWPPRPSRKSHLMTSLWTGANSTSSSGLSTARQQPACFCMLRSSGSFTLSSKHSCLHEQQ